MTDKIKNEYISVRVPDDLREQLEAKAARKGMKLSNLVRNVLEKYIKPESVEV